jgi:hypothetical protein
MMATQPPEKEDQQHSQIDRRTSHLVAPLYEV